jgi:hypothetical protein
VLTTDDAEASIAALLDHLDDADETWRDLREGDAEPEVGAGAA